jgi:hypothetical protein
MVPYVGALELQERDGGESPACFTMSFMPSRSTNTSKSLRRVVITVKDMQDSQIPQETRPQPTLVQDKYLDKLMQNIESESPQEVKKPSNLSSNSSSLPSKHSFGKSFAKSDSIVNIPSVQRSNRSEVLVEENHHR